MIDCKECVHFNVCQSFGILTGRLTSCPTFNHISVIEGKWHQIQRWTTKAKYQCSVCGRTIMSAVKVNIEKYPYCHCGAKMSEGNML